MTTATDEDLELRLALARSLWAQRNPEAAGADKQARIDQWNQAKPGMMQEAASVIRALNKNGVTLARMG